MIEVENLTKRYGYARGIEDVSFSLSKGQILGFLGPNGAGKTTTMKILTGFLQPTAGKVTIDNLDIISDSLEIRKRIGYLPESTPLYQEMGVVEYLDYISQLRQIPKAHQAKRVREIVDICGLGEVIGKDIKELSKGFKQRVGLAQSLIHDPQILILDEPTSGLDPRQIIEIRKLIRTLGKEKTIILSTHIMQEVSATCDSVIIINQGKIVAQGTPNELQDKASSGGEIGFTVRAKKDDVNEILQNEKYLTSFKLLGEVDGKLSYKLTASTEDASEQLFKLAVKKKWVVSELHQDKVSLEDIFVKLTEEA
jgi:ABC-2 type transport system ATP-binding protein